MRPSASRSLAAPAPAEPRPICPPLGHIFTRDEGALPCGAEWRLTTGMAGWWFSGNDGGSSKGRTAPSAEAVQFEHQIEMMDMVFRRCGHIPAPAANFAARLAQAPSLTRLSRNHRTIKLCGKKCIPPTYKDGELNKGEVVCTQRCLAKFFDVLEIVGSQLTEIGMQAQQQTL